MVARSRIQYKQELASHGIEFEEGGHSEERILQADEVMKSPGIPHKNELVKKIVAAGISINSEKWNWLTGLKVTARSLA